VIIAPTDRLEIVAVAGRRYKPDRAIS